MFVIDVAEAVIVLVKKAQDTSDATDALKFSQAACNVANAKACLMATLPATVENTG